MNMDINMDLRKAVFIGMLALLGPMKANGDARKAIGHQASPDSNMPISEKVKEYVDISSLSTKILTDSEDVFEAILFDYQSQYTIAHMVWNKGDGSYKVHFSLGDIKDTIPLQISDINNLGTSERMSVLLKGLHEAGIAWLSQSNDLPVFDKHSNPDKSKQENVTIQSFYTKGFIDWISPKKVEYRLEPMRNITRTASGWAYDPDQPSRSIWVHFYGHRDGHSGFQYIGALLANLSRPDVNRTGIPGNHGWRSTVPEGWDADGYNDYSKSCGVGSDPLDPRSSYYVCRVTIKAYGIDVSGDSNVELSHSPYVIESVSYSFNP
jgi:hypothetical protein